MVNREPFLLPVPTIHSKTSWLDPTRGCPVPDLILIVSNGLLIQLDSKVPSPKKQSPKTSAPLECIYDSLMNCVNQALLDQIQILNGFTPTSSP